MANATTHHTTKMVQVREEEFILKLAHDEADTLSSLLFNHIGGTCPDRDRLSEIGRALRSAGASESPLRCKDRDRGYGILVLDE